MKLSPRERTVASCMVSVYLERLYIPELVLLGL